MKPFCDNAELLRMMDRVAEVGCASSPLPSTDSPHTTFSTAPLTLAFDGAATIGRNCRRYLFNGCVVAQSS